MYLYFLIICFPTTVFFLIFLLLENNEIKSYSHYVVLCLVLNVFEPFLI